MAIEPYRGELEQFDPYWLERMYEEWDEYEQYIEEDEDATMTDEQTRLALAERTTGNVQPGNRDREQLAAYALMRARSRIEALEAENERLRETLHWYAFECDWSFTRTDSEAHLNLWSYDKGVRARQALGAMKGDSHE